MSSGKWRPFCLDLNVLTLKQLQTHGCRLRAVASDGFQYPQSSPNVNQIGPILEKNLFTGSNIIKSNYILKKKILLFKG